MGSALWRDHIVFMCKTRYTLFSTGSTQETSPYDQLKISGLAWADPELILHEMMVLITSACGEGSDEPACTYALARALASRTNKVCKFKKTRNNF